MTPRNDWDPFAPEKPKSRLTPLGKLVVYGGAATFVVGATALGALWFWRPAPQLPALLPADTRGIVLLRPTVRALVGLPMLRRAYPEVFNYPEAVRLRGELQRELGLELERDVLPWLGSEAGVAFLGPGAVAGDAGVVAVAARDEAGLEACLTKIADRRALLGDAVEPRSHAGASYRVVRPARGGRAWAYGRLGWLAVATSDEATYRALAERAREPGKHGPSLAQDEAYAAVDRALPHDAVLTGYLAGGAAPVAALAGAGAGPAEQLVAWMAALRGTGFGLAMRNDGVEAATVVSLDERKLSPYAKEGLAEFAKPVAPGLVDDAPAGALAALAFRFPAQARDALAAAWRDQRRQLPPAATAGLEAAGVDPERDLLAWLPGDVGAVALPASPGVGALPLDVYLASRPTRPADADAALGRIAAAVDRAALGMGMTQADEQGLHVVRELATRRVVVAYGRQGPEVRLAIGEGAFTRITTHGPRLGGTEAYEAVAGRLPRPHAGLFFLDVAAAQAAARPFTATLPPTPPQVARGLESLRAVGGASSPGLSRDGLLRSSMFFHIVEPSQLR